MAGLALVTLSACDFTDSSRDDIEPITIPTHSANEILEMTFAASGFGTVCDFPNFHINFVDGTIQESFDITTESGENLVVERGSATPAEIEDVRQKLGGDDMPQMLTNLLMAAEEAKPYHNRCLDGGPYHLTLKYTDGEEDAFTINDCGIPYDDQDVRKPLFAAKDIIRKYEQSFEERQANCHGSN